MIGNEQKSETRTRTATGRRVRRRWRALAGAGTAGVMATVMLLLLGSALGAATNTAASFHAPYSGGKAVQYRDPVSQGCGASLSVKKVAMFNVTSGVGSGWASARAGTCATSDSQAGYDGIVGVQSLGFKSTVSGTHSVVATWVVTWNASASMTAAAANAGAQATVEIWLQVKLTDTTTGATTVGKVVFIVQKDLQSASSFTGGAVKRTYAAGLPSVALASGHSYTLYVVLGYDLQAVVPAGSPATAMTTATVNLGSANHGGTLSSVVVN